MGRAVTVSSGLSDLSSVLAEAEAEVDGRSPSPSKKILEVHLPEVNHQK